MKVNRQCLLSVEYNFEKISPKTISLGAKKELLEHCETAEVVKIKNILKKFPLLINDPLVSRLYSSNCAVVIYVVRNRQGKPCS
jgi:hypothetical protein